MEAVEIDCGDRSRTGTLASAWDDDGDDDAVEGRDTAGGLDFSIRYHRSRVALPSPAPVSAIE